MTTQTKRLYRSFSDRYKANRRATNWSKPGFKMTLGKTFPTVKLVSVACEVTRTCNPTAYRLARLFFNRSMLPVYCLGYAYFRWLDDLVDAPNALNNLVRTMLDRQRDIISAMYEYETQSIYLALNIYEQMLVELISYDRTNGQSLQTYITDMLGLLEFDAKRRYQLCKQKDLDDYSRSLGRAYTKVLQICTARGNFLANNHEDNLAGYAAHQAHILRDFYIDVPLGYFNISQEYMKSLGYTLEQLSSMELDQLDLRPWVRDTVSTGTRAFIQGLKAIKQIRNWRCRLLGYVTSAQYIYVLEKIKQNDYCLQRDYTASSIEKRRMLAWALKMSFISEFDINSLIHKVTIAEPQNS